MAKKNDPAPTDPAPVIPDPVPAPLNYWEGVTPVMYEDLIKARVLVHDAAGNRYYLDPAHRSGEFILRVLPKS